MNHIGTSIKWVIRLSASNFLAILANMEKTYPYVLQALLPAQTEAILPETHQVLLLGVVRVSNLEEANKELQENLPWTTRISLHRAALSLCKACSKPYDAKAQSVPVWSR